MDIDSPLDKRMTMAVDSGYPTSGYRNLAIVGCGTQATRIVQNSSAGALIAMAYGQPGEMAIHLEVERLLSALLPVVYAPRGMAEVFVLACLGRRTGSALAPAVANWSKGMDLRVSAIVSMPILIEGEARRFRAVEALSDLRSSCHEVTVVAIPEPPSGSALLAFQHIERLLIEATRNKLASHG
jgi:hypothetical protein